MRETVQNFSTNSTGNPLAERWRAPNAHGRIDTTIRIPASKSITNRAYILAAQARRPTVIDHPLDSRDAQLMVEALGALGAHAESSPSRVRMHPIGTRNHAGHVTVALGNSGTVARFTPPIAALGSATVRFDGDHALRRRPLLPLLRALSDLGADIDGGPGACANVLPFTMRGTDGLPGGPVTLDSSASSQFLSALLLAGPSFDQGVTVRLRGGAPPSEPHIAMTLDLLRTFGAAPERDRAEFHVPPAELGRDQYTVEPDLSSAAPFLAAAALTGGTVRVLDWPPYTTQPGDWLRSLLSELGMSVQLDEHGLTVTGTGSLPGIHLDLHDVSELTPVLAAMLCFAEQPSEISGVAHLRGHETDRLAALAAELTALGGNVTQTETGLRIVPAPLHAGTFHTYEDHRLVMAAAVIGLRVPHIEVEDPSTVGKTFPDFIDTWEGMLT